MPPEVFTNAKERRNDGKKNLGMDDNSVCIGGASLYDRIIGPGKVHRQIDGMNGPMMTHNDSFTMMIVLRNHLKIPCIMIILKELMCRIMCPFILLYQSVCVPSQLLQGQ